MDATDKPKQAGHTDTVNDKKEEDEDDCAICLYPLSEQETIRLSCGHRWHIACVQDQVRHAAPNPARRLVLNGIRCALCKAVCTHAAIDAAVEPTAALQRQVDELIVDQIVADDLCNAPAVRNPTSTFHGHVLEYARSIYAFFLCGLCDKPYFGGLVSCNDVYDQDLPVDDRLCPVCSPRSSALCVDSVHRASFVWKCRLCCRVADFVCYGSTHLCASCHSRDDGTRHRGVLAIEPEPCPGPACRRAPLPHGVARHVNDQGVQGELLLRCGVCASSPGGTVALRAQRGSSNMLFNPDGAHERRGWDGKGWKVETSEVPFGSSLTNFVSSHYMGYMSQTVDLSTFVRRPDAVRIEVSARYLRRTDCPAEFSLHAALYDRFLNRVAQFATPKLDAPAEFWEYVHHVFEPTARARYAVISVHGRDKRFWNGWYGAKVVGCSVRVLYDASASEDGSNIVHLQAFDAIRPRTSFFAQRNDGVMSEDLRNMET